MAKCHPGFWGGIFSNFGERMEGLQNSGWWLLFLSTAIFHSIFGLFNYIFFNKNIELLKWHPILTPTIGAKTLFMGAKTLFRVAKWHLTPLFWQLPLELLLNLCKIITLLRKI